VPAFLAFAVVKLLEGHFSELVDYEFTAQMEDALDQMARGEAERVPSLRQFSFGPGGQRSPRPRPRRDPGPQLHAERVGLPRRSR
jgi:hypothetical protein